MNKKKDAGDQRIPIPKAYAPRILDSLYSKIPLKYTVSGTLLKYFNAMANLYGIIPLKKAFEIISEQSPSLVTEDEFLAFAEIARHESDLFYILAEDEIFTDGKKKSVWEREIIDVMLICENLDPYLKTREIQQGKPYFIPDKRRLLSYNDPWYYEKTPEVRKMKRFLATRFFPDASKLDKFLSEMLYGMRCRYANLPETVNRLQALGFGFSKEPEAQKFVDLYQNLHNRTRMQCNRGFTPEEVFCAKPPEERMPRSVSFGPNIRKSIADGTIDVDEMRREVMSMELPSEELRSSILKALADAVDAARKQPGKTGGKDPRP